MRLGIRAHDLGVGTASEVAALAAARNLQVIQLAPAKALCNAPEVGQWSSAFAQQTRQAFAQQGVQIAVLGCYINPIHPDLACRRAEINRFKEVLRFAHDFGAQIVGTETGSKHADCSPHPENHSEAAYVQLRETLQELVAEAERLGVTIGLEAVTQHVAHDVECLHRLISELNSDAVGVIFDPVNLLSPASAQNQAAFLDHALSLLGPRIVAVHAKDFVVQGQSMVRVPPGQGQLDYALLLQRIGQLKPNIPVLMEETAGAGRDPALVYLRQFDALC